MTSIDVRKHFMVPYYVCTHYTCPTIYTLHVLLRMCTLHALLRMSTLHALLRMCTLHALLRMSTLHALLRMCTLHALLRTYVHFACSAMCTLHVLNKYASSENEGGIGISNLHSLAVCLETVYRSCFHGGSIVAAFRQK